MTMTPRQVKTFFIRTYGCQMNELDSEIMVGQLEKRGLTRIDEENEADLLIFNTCSIRDLAERKVMGKLGQLGRRPKEDARHRRHGLHGDGQKRDRSSASSPMSILSSGPIISPISTTSSMKSYRPDSRRSGPTINSKKISTISSPNETTQSKPMSRSSAAAINSAPTASSPIPAARKSPALLKASSKNAACSSEQGYKEITLLGQNVNSYGKDKPEWNCLFHDLLYRLDKIPGHGTGPLHDHPSRRYHHRAHAGDPRSPFRSANSSISLCRQDPTAS